MYYKVSSLLITLVSVTQFIYRKICIYLLTYTSSYFAFYMKKMGVICYEHWVGKLMGLYKVMMVTESSKQDTP